MDTSPALRALGEFRAALYAGFGHRADALLTTGPTLSPAHLSLAPIHRRGWGSLYAALAQGRIPRAAVRALVARYPLADGHPFYAVDVSVWPRCDAETSPGRGFYYHSSRHSAGQPIVAGWAYQWINQLSLTADSWTAARCPARLAGHRRQHRGGYSDQRPGPPPARRRARAPVRLRRGLRFRPTGAGSE